MAMTIHQMRIFWAVSQAQSYTKASKMLGLAQAYRYLNKFQNWKMS